MVQTVPTGWEEKSVCDICNVYQPQTISSKDLIPDGKYTVFGANGIIGRYNSYNHEKSEVLVTCRGATCGSINKSLPFSWINGNAMVVSPKDENIISKDYLYHFLAATDFTYFITGAAQPQITRVGLSSLKISYPPLPEQERIVAKLDKAFEATVGFISTVAEFTPKTVQTESLRTNLVYEVRLTVSDPDGELRLGMPVTAKLLP